MKSNFIDNLIVNIKRIENFIPNGVLSKLLCSFLNNSNNINTLT